MACCDGHASYLPLVTFPRAGYDEEQHHLQGARSLGSGIVFDLAGQVLTAAHVVGEVGTRVYGWTRRGKHLYGTVTKVWPDADLAAVSFDLAGADLRPARPVSGMTSLLGQQVSSIGTSPGAAFVDREGVVLDDNLELAARYGSYGFDNALLVQLAGSRGDSGGPVFAHDGRLVGMVLARLDRPDLDQPLTLVLPTRRIAQLICRVMACDRQWQAAAESIP